jgi:hypothetical protein
MGLALSQGESDFRTPMGSIGPQKSGKVDGDPAHAGRGPGLRRPTPRQKAALGLPPALRPRAFGRRAVASAEGGPQAGEGSLARRKGTRWPNKTK